MQCHRGGLLAIGRAGRFFSGVQHEFADQLFQYQRGRGELDLVAGGQKVPQLTIGGINVVNQVVSVDSRSQAVEYNMQFTTEYSITVPDHEPQKFTASFSRNFLNKSSEALASSREQEQRTREMQEQTADLLLIQLSRVTF